MTKKKKNGDLDMRYSSSKEKAKRRHKWEILFTAIALIYAIIKMLQQ